MDVKVSVVVAVYNSAKYLRQTLDSICSQTLRDIEIILVDDGSSDGSLAILNEYASKDDRITVLSQKEPSDGAALARNLGVLHARGEYVSVLDADDIFEHEMLEKAYNMAVNTGAEAVIYDGDLYDGKLEACRRTGMILRREFLPEEEVFEPKDNADKLFFMTIGAAWNVLWKRELIEREKLKFYSFHHADDLGFVYLGFATAKKIAILPEHLVHYRISNSESQAANLEKWPEAAAGAMSELKKALKKRGLFETYKVTFTEIALHYFELYLHRMSDYDSFEKLYLSWKDLHAEELGLLEVPDERLVQNRIAKIRERLKKLSPGEYLFEKENRCGLFNPDAKWRSVIPKGSRIVLYAAGKCGRFLFSELISSGEYDLVAWTDAKAENYGYPVISINEALDKAYDFVLVGVESSAVFKDIRQTLVKMGVDAKRIVQGDLE